jgi:hypothetical protein
VRGAGRPSRAPIEHKAGRPHISEVKGMCAR